MHSFLQLKKQDRQRGVVLVAVTVSLLLIAAALGGIYLMAQSALKNAQPQTDRAELNSFAREMVELCGNILRVNAGTYATGVSDVDAYIAQINSDPYANLSLVQQSSPDTSRLPPGTLGTSGIEQELYASLGTDVYDPYQDAALWRFDRTAGGDFIPDLIATRNQLQATIDLDYIGRDTSGGAGGSCGVFKWGNELKCVGGGGSGGVDGGAANPVAAVFQPGLYRCRVDARDTGGDQQFIVEAIIRSRGNW